MKGAENAQRSSEMTTGASSQGTRPRLLLCARYGCDQGLRLTLGAPALDRGVSWWKVTSLRVSREFSLDHEEHEAHEGDNPEGSAFRRVVVDAMKTDR